MLVHHLLPNPHSPQPLSIPPIPMSRAGECRRRVWYETHSPVPIPHYLSLSAREGLLHEGAILSALHQAGLSLSYPQTVDYTDPAGTPWRGRPDAILSTQEGAFGIEVKTLSHQHFQSLYAYAHAHKDGAWVLPHSALPSLPWGWWAQIALYQASFPHTQGWVLVVKDRDTGELAECLVPSGALPLSQVASRWASFLPPSPTPPERDFPFSSPQCSLCPYRSPCWDGHRPQPVPYTLPPQEGERLAQMWRQGHALSAQGSALTETVRSTILALYHEHGGRYNRFVLTPHLALSVSEAQRLTPQTSVLYPLLEHLAQEGVIPSDTLERAFARTPFTTVREVKP